MPVLVILKITPKLCFSRFLGNGHRSCTSRKMHIHEVDLQDSPEVIVETVKNACLLNGFFYVKNHGIDEDLIEQTLENMKQYFALSYEEKLKNVVSRTHMRGFVPAARDEFPNWRELPADKVKRKEEFYIGREVPEDSIEAKQFPFNNSWPSESALPNFRETLNRYFYSLWELSIRLLKIILISLELPKTALSKMGILEKPCLILRAIHYLGEVADLANGIVNTNTHTDYGLLTILLTDGNPGLEVQSKEGEWTEVLGKPGYFIVNLGDMLQKITDGLYKSNKHRVLLKEAKDRYSIAYFVEPNVNAKLLPLLNVDGSEQGEVTYGDYLAKSVAETQGQYLDLYSEAQKASVSNNY